VKPFDRGRGGASFSRLSKGGRVLELPGGAQQAVPLSTLEPMAEVVGDGQIILIVEDDPVTRDALRESLENLNYRVLLAADGAQALEVIDHQRGLIGLIISDLVMPRMGGRELYRAVRQRFPLIKLILISGYPLGGDTQELLDTGIATWIQKPFVSDALVEKVAGLLADGR